MVPLESLFYIILAILGLSFLIFIHELGHYFMARRVGMRVETFSIGFGKPIYSWERDGVKWQIGWLLFGGFVRIAGTDTDGEQDPYTIPDGFFGKKPLDRILVAAMGPFANFVLAIALFGLLWGLGGRVKSFSEFTNKVGWVDPQSELYAEGVRPGDEILAYDDYPFQNAKDHLQAPIMSGEELHVQGLKVNYGGKTLTKTPFVYDAKVYPHPASLNKGIVTVGILDSANYILYDRLPGGAENPLPEGSPMRESGIQYGDRILWVDGEIVFSLQHLNDILNDGRAFLTVQRGPEHLLRRVPRVPVEELFMDNDFKEELGDWRFEAEIETPVRDLFTIPYNLDYNAVVENPLRFLDEENEEEAFPKHLFSPLDQPLQVGDKIVAVDGSPIQRSYQLLNKLQKHRVHLIVQREEDLATFIPWEEANQTFDQHIDWKNIQAITHTIGTEKLLSQSGNLYLLKAITPKMRREIALTSEKQAEYEAALQEQKKEIEAIEDPERREEIQRLLDEREDRQMLGISIQDRKVSYNPGPFALFRNVFSEIGRTLTALLTGSLSPKWVSGPVGIVQVVHAQWMVGIKEALFWLGAISVNLGFLNLLPIPILDGGTILLSLFEWVTGKQLKPKTMEKLIVPFAVILIAFFLYLTFNDLSRIFGRFF